MTEQHAPPMPDDNELLAVPGDPDLAGGHRHFARPLFGVDVSVPDEVDRQETAALCLALGDDALVTALRLGEWLTGDLGPADTAALAGIGLDLVGQARMLLARSGQLDGTGRTEEELARGRAAEGFRNALLCEAPTEDLAFGAGRLLLLSLWRAVLFETLVDAADPVLAAVAAMGLRELAGHADLAARWVVRLGRGARTSHRRMGEAMSAVVSHLDELCEASPPCGLDPAAVRSELERRLAPVLSAAALTGPDESPAHRRAHPGGGRAGQHQYLEQMLTEARQEVPLHAAASR